MRTKIENFVDVKLGPPLCLKCEKNLAHNRWQICKECQKLKCKICYGDVKQYALGEICATCAKARRMKLQKLSTAFI
jgi:hypothetical protein